MIAEIEAADFDQGLVVSLCPVCGEEVVYEDGVPHNMGGEPHQCPEQQP